MKKWILLVEDSADDVELTKLAFEENDITNPLVVARDGAEALELLTPERIAEAGEMPTLILLDLNLPKVNGIEVLRQIRGNERTRMIPVVVLTSSEEECDLLDTYSIGANSYVRKPVDFADFLAAIRHLGIYWLLLNRVPSETYDHA